MLHLVLSHLYFDTAQRKTHTLCAGKGLRLGLEQSKKEDLVPRNFLIFLLFALFFKFCPLDSHGGCSGQVVVTEWQYEDTAGRDMSWQGPTVMCNGHQILSPLCRQSNRPPIIGNSGSVLYSNMSSCPEREGWPGNCLVCPNSGKGLFVALNCLDSKGEIFLEREKHWATFLL